MEHAGWRDCAMLFRNLECRQELATNWYVRCGLLAFESASMEGRSVRRTARIFGVISTGLIFVWQSGSLASAQHLTVEPNSAANCGQSSAGYLCDCCDPVWSATADAIFLNRSEPSPKGMLFDLNTNAEIFNARDFDFDTEVGPRVELFRRLGPNRGMSIEYFGIDKWQADASFGPGNYYFLADMAGGPDVTSLDLNYETELHSAEFNVWGGMNRRLNFFGGFRWVRLDDDLRVAGMLAPSDGNAPFTGAYSANNNLYGFQVGTTGTIFEWWRLRLEGVAKAGIFYNDTDTNFLAQSTVFGQFAADDSDSQAAFVGELGLNLSLQVTSHIALRGGYQVMWLSGVATAVDQISVTSADLGTTSVNAAGSLFFHGANAGVEVSW